MPNRKLTVRAIGRHSQSVALAVSWYQQLKDSCTVALVIGCGDYCGRRGLGPRGRRPNGGPLPPSGGGRGRRRGGHPNGGFPVWSCGSHVWSSGSPVGLGGLPPGGNGRRRRHGGHPNGGLPVRSCGSHVWSWGSPMGLGRNGRRRPGGPGRKRCGWDWAVSSRQKTSSAKHSVTNGFIFICSAMTDGITNGDIKVITSPNKILVGTKQYLNRINPNNTAKCHLCLGLHVVEKIWIAYDIDLCIRI